MRRQARNRFRVWKKLSFFPSTSTSCREKLDQDDDDAIFADKKTYYIIDAAIFSSPRCIQENCECALWDCAMRQFSPWKSVYCMCDSTTASIWWCIGMLLPACSNRRCMPPTKLRVWFPSTICRHSRTGRGLVRFLSTWLGDQWVIAEQMWFVQFRHEKSLSFLGCWVFSGLIFMWKCFFLKSLHEAPHIYKGKEANKDSGAPI